MVGYLSLYLFSNCLMMMLVVVEDPGQLTVHTCSHVSTPECVPPSPCEPPLCRYATIYTMFPVFSLVLDQDVKPEMALLYPELYKDLTKVRRLPFKRSCIRLTSRLHHVKVYHTHVWCLCFRDVRCPSRRSSFGFWSVCIKVKRANLQYDSFSFPTTVSFLVSDVAPSSASNSSTVSFSVS